MTKTPLELYQEKCQQGFITQDKEQLTALQHFERIFIELIKENNRRQQIISFLKRKKLVKGLYLWGSVGIGKTFLMDCFYQALPFPNKIRMHFHQFMQWMHQELILHQGKKNPLEYVAEDLAAKAIVLCFDELFVSDITDAMLLGRLFKALSTRGVCLVATSNVLPDELYKNGLQREQFLPAIALLKENTEVFHLPTHEDYRLRHLREAGVFYTPLSKETTEKMEANFSILTNNLPFSSDPITIHDRLIPVKKRCGDVIWFEFNDICHVPRSQQDFLALAEQFRTIFISNIPVFSAQDKDTICLFISLVDVFYDARVRLVISAAESVADLYSQGYMVMEYTRTHSRLLEMQSEDYFYYELKRTQ